MQRRDFLAGGAAAVLLVGGRAVGEIAPASGECDDASAQPGAHAISVHSISMGSRLLFISGQVPVDADGNTLARFSPQCRLAWRNVEAQLAAAGMGLRHLVKVTVFLAHVDDRRRERDIRRERLCGLARPSVSVVVTGIYDEAWRIEIEAIALA
ncbi:RidA family protein [Lysobacter sp. CA199]|uniref:RidA family protein n=1 Tax=Lysobacter sp. CA199 TaxID=3455608 RepID=UPI003F8CFE3D